MVLPAPPTRWFGTGHSLSTEPTVAAKESVQAALAGRDAALVLVFCSATYDLTELTDAIRGQVGTGTVIAGCTSNGQLVTPQPLDSGIVAIALGGPGFQVTARIGRNVPADRRAAGETIAEAVTGLDRQHRVLLLLNEGLAGKQHEVIRGAYARIGAGVPLVGGCSADGDRYMTTYQFCGDAHGVEVFTDAVVGIGLGSDAPVGIGIAHGWQRSGEAMMATGAEGGRLFELDDRPALDVYLDLIGADRSLLDDRATFRSTALTNPLGMSRRTCEDIRVVHAADPDDGSLLCLADIPQGALIWQMTTRPEDLVDAAAQSCAQAVAGLGGAAPTGLIAFDCGARRLLLGPEGRRREAAAIAETLGEVPFAGWYTYGEIARTEGSRGLHHLTFVSLALA